jgi:hypothetical protein
MNTRLSIIGTAVALALAVAPAALSAGIHPDDRALSRATSPDLVRSQHPDDRAVSRATSPDLVRSQHPDDRAVSRATSPDLVSSPHPDDRALPRASNPIGPSETLVRVADRGFDWADFGVGAIGGFGIALALMGATLIVLRLPRREARPA